MCICSELFRNPEAVCDSNHLNGFKKNPEEKKSVFGFTSAIVPFQNMRLVGFTPLLLHIIMDEGVDCSARQAAVIYLKNVINRYLNCEEIN